MEKKCPVCKGNFKGKKKQVFCSRKCRGVSDTLKNRVEVKCSNCDTKFYKTRYQANRTKDHYCKKSCKSEHYKTKFNGANNPNWKQLTNKIKCDNCKVEFVYSDYYASNYKYCSYNCKAVHQKTTLQGKNNPNYKRDKKDYLRIKERQYTGYKEWRLKVFKRDGFNCLNCGTNSTVNNRLVAHHIVNHHSYPEGRIDVDNGATLCSECHWEFHRLYGTMNNNQKQLNDFLKKTL